MNTRRRIRGVGPEVENQADLDDGAPEIVEQLCDMSRIDGACSLELDQNSALDQEVGPKPSDGASTEPRVQFDF